MLVNTLDSMHIINSAINRWLFFKNIRYQNLIKKTGNQLWFPVFSFNDNIIYQPATLACENP